MSLIVILVSYIIGSIPFSYLIARFIGGIDIRQVGSGNVGTTNVARSMGVKYAVMAYLLDMSKGLFSFLFFRHLGGYEMGVIAGFAAILGHCYSPFMGFKGGKGIAVSSGFLMGAAPLIIGILLLVQLVVVLIFRMMGLASVVVSLLFPVLCYFLGNPILFKWSFLISAFVIFQHRANIKRILKGEEKKLF